jgi:predicted lipid-binding transport protein (Tim44 family)
MPAPAEADADLFAPTAEIALFIGGALLTLLVIGFVTMLVISIVREERAAAAAKATTQDGDDR